MKGLRKHAKRLSAVAALILTLGSMRAAETMTIELFVIDSGRETLSNGTYSLTGAIGEPVSGEPLSGGVYSLKSGFTSVIVALALDNEPVLLRISRSGASVTVSWPLTLSPKFELEVTSSLSAPVTWVQVTELPVAAGGLQTVSIPTVPGSKFYRLRRIPPPQ